MYNQLVVESADELKSYHVHRVKQDNQLHSRPSKHHKPSNPIVEWCVMPLRYLSKSTRRPKVALASYPGSGNTWVRYLLQQSTGILTGSVHKGSLINKEGVFPGK